MTFVSAGYDGTVDETQFAQMLNRYSIVGADDFKATTIAGDRTVSIGDGVALGPGTIDLATDLPSIQFAAANGTRWDMVVLRRDWQPPGGNTTIAIIQGGASKTLPTREQNPGVLDDQPLYLQAVNGNLLGARVDLRCWSSNSGLVAADDLARNYLNTPGARVLVGAKDWAYLPGANGSFGWVDLTAPGANVNLDYGAGSVKYGSFPAPKLRMVSPGHVRVEGMFKPGTSDETKSLLGIPDALESTYAPPVEINKGVDYRTTASTYGRAMAKITTSGSFFISGLPSTTDYVSLDLGWFL